MPVLLSNRALTAAEIGGQAGTVGEPSIAKRGSQILFTGNWYATRSPDDGASWRLLNPYTFFPPVDNGFCCDQTALYEPSRGLTVWLLQYSRKDGTNTLRLAINRAADMANNAWTRWDFKPQQVNSQWAGEWFDYNHAAFSNNFLYVGTNAYLPISADENRWTRYVLFRFPLDTLKNGGSLTYNYYQSTDNSSLRCTQGATNVMYFASHNGLQQIRLHAWPDNSNQVTRYDINVAPWTHGPRFAYATPCPDGSDWLRRCDGRITGGYAASGEIGFLWTANRRQDRPFPYVRVVRFREAATPTLLSQHDIFNRSYAYAYPDACPNSAGEIGICLFRGGGTMNPGHVVGVMDRATGGWQLAATRDGTNGPADNVWGDYLTCRRDSTNPAHWVATGYTMQGGGTRNFTEPRYVRFSV